MTTLALWVVVLGGFYLLLEVLCERGERLHGVPWFDIAHEVQPPTKKAKGRMQRRKKHR